VSPDLSALPSLKMKTWPSSQSLPKNSKESYSQMRTTRRTLLPSNPSSLKVQRRSKRSANSLFKPDPLLVKFWEISPTSKRPRILPRNPALKSLKSKRLSWKMLLKSLTKLPTMYNNLS